MSGPQCCSNPPVLNPNGGAGHVEKLGGLNTYITGSPSSKLAIVLISDILSFLSFFKLLCYYWILCCKEYWVLSVCFGYEAPNLRKLADKTAAVGFFAVVPDFFHGDPFHGDPYVPENADRPITVWLKDHGTGFEEAKLVIEALKSKGFSAIGASGFCWGGKVVVELAKSDFIQAAVILHPALVTVEDIKEVKVPISVLGAEVDRPAPPELVKQFEEALAAKSGLDFHVKVFPKVEHGWTTRYSVEDEEAVKKAEEAHQDMLEWFSKHV
ncbi:hypothetical protein FNV43_RR01876 [Rhamnella rubrinervis]|uniref:Dienelactone hydrolase domain-containing protein n=1 Tax=Rhamnella rubrinervis TaxID=2594499 RepID=A0A8K0MTA2_9ROSA|nr:hypothetical protein FNV43_RR01876 [Rhamnella rubrinervis]